MLGTRRFGWVGCWLSQVEPFWLSPWWAGGGAGRRRADGTGDGSGGRHLKARPLKNINEERVIFVGETIW